jgi:transcriptional regulator with XRE-family HTH domain
MVRGTPSLLPRLARLLTQAGGNLKAARLRRKFSAETVAQRAGISRKTLYRVEQGDPAVALGIDARVMQALRLEQDLASLAADDELGRKLQDAGLLTRKRAPRQKKPAEVAPSQGGESDTGSAVEPLEDEGRA